MVLEVMHGSVEMVRKSEIVGHEIVPTNMQSSLGNVEFSMGSMGWIEVSEKKSKVKSSHSKQASKGSTMVAKEVGADLTKGNKKGTWTRLPCKPNNEQMQIEKVVTLGPKRKAKEGGSTEEDVIEIEKKQKLDDETKRLNVLFATHLGSTEVAG